ncbi:MAG: hypothetical protein MZW92_32485 [Comamonadaceae bacterium]|nr:hypothetical protein [Comamonadaceae bacterium]
MACMRRCASVRWPRRCRREARSRQRRGAARAHGAVHGPHRPLLRRRSCAVRRGRTRAGRRRAQPAATRRVEPADLGGRQGRRPRRAVAGTRRIPRHRRPCLPRAGHGGRLVDRRTRPAAVGQRSTAHAVATAEHPPLSNGAQGAAPSGLAGTATTPSQRSAL